MNQPFPVLVKGGGVRNVVILEQTPNFIIHRSLDLSCYCITHRWSKKQVSMGIRDLMEALGIAQALEEIGIEWHKAFSTLSLGELKHMLPSHDMQILMENVSL